jgi:hypothetical protein
LSKKPIKTETTYTISGYESLAELQALVVADPKGAFELEMYSQLLKLRIERGEKPAAVQHLMHLKHRILHDGASAMDMIEIARILQELVNQDLAFQVLYGKKRGRSQRTAKLCLEIMKRVLQVHSERDLPIRDSTSDGKSDAIAIVSEERERARTKPWAYDTVKHYHDQGVRLLSEVQNKALDSLTHAAEFISKLEVEPQEPE